MNTATFVGAAVGALAAAGLAMASPGLAHADRGDASTGPSVGSADADQADAQSAQFQAFRNAIRSGQINSTSPVPGLDDLSSDINFSPDDISSLPSAVATLIAVGR